MGQMRWLALAGVSALLSSALLALHMPAAVLLGCMVCALVVSVRGIQLSVPRRFFGWGQGLLGCLMAQSLHPTQLGGVVAHWPEVVGTTLFLIAASSALGWWLMRRQVMPGTTAVWGMAPGAASAMVVMAEQYGADVRLVAFMQYTRVLAVTIVAALVARAAGAHAPVASGAVDWLALGAPADLLLTGALVLGGGWLARRLDIPGGAMVVPLVACVAVQLIWGASPALPPALMALAYAAIGWSVGLRFTQGVLLHALRALPQVMGAIGLLMLAGLASGAVLVFTMGLDPLSAYLATSPGGADSMAVIAATSAVETSFVMAMQLARFLMVLVAGPAISRWLARYGPG